MNFTIVGQSEIVAKPRSSASGVEKVSEGDLVPSVDLIDQSGNATGLVDEDGRWPLLTFIFTRCPIQAYCPRMSGHFQEIQNQPSNETGKSLRLLSVLIDPQGRVAWIWRGNDWTPDDILKAFAAL